MSFTPHTEHDIKIMLDEIGIANIQQLFDEVPENLLINKKLDLPEPLNELETTRLMQARARLDADYQCFIGAGAYEHYIPAAVWEITGRGEFLTAYTPYQAEASQGSLQLIYEYQSMMASLTGLQVSNASLYDGATALAEAILMSVREQEKKKAKKVLVAGSLNPLYIETVTSIISLLNIELITTPIDLKTGVIDINTLSTIDIKEVAALVIQQPNFFGQLEHVDELTNWAHQHNLLVIANVNPTSLALLKEPGAWGDTGADIACGEGQPLGIPLASGGPYFGFLTCKKEFVRQMPGRIVGRTVDQDGKQGFTLTLQAREQHIRRAKAKSNICTNQGLLVTAATIYMSLMGPEGLRRVATTSHNNAVTLQKLLSEMNGLEILFTSPFFHEFVIRTDKPVQEVLNYFEKNKILAGFDLTKDFPELGNALLICVTETKTENDLEHFTQLMKAAVSIKEKMDYACS